jgi:chromosome segregation protein
MRLKKLIVHGFKSFADRTEFVFDAPVTGIVGPNGCGKSNVVDAFKWVLGEQSAKSLRGDAMMDVIFNGSGNRKPSGMAEVTLVFENDKRDDGTRTLPMDVDEVAVGRRLFRDGGSEYHLNNKTSRLKDVRELFLDTGVGVDAYSVIEQGRVSALLEANPAERRLIFEEAAGVSKYKVKKKEAQRKLEKVDLNLLRVNDVVTEVEKQLRGVKIQAGKARVFQENSTRLAELRTQYAVHEYHTQHTAMADARRQVDEAQFAADDAAGDLTAAEKASATARDNFDVLSQGKQRVEYDLVQTRASLDAAKQQQNYAGRQLKMMADQVESFDRDQATAKAKLDEISTALAAHTRRLQSLTTELQAAKDSIEQKQLAFRDGQLKLTAINREVDQHKAAVLDLMRKSANVGSRLGAIGIERKNNAAQRDRLTQRRDVVQTELDAATARVAEVKAKLDEAVARITERQAKLEEKKLAASALGKQIASTADRLGAAKEHRSGLQSRQKLLTDLEARREGVSEGVKAVLKNRDTKYPFVRGLVADVLRVDVEHAHVIEAALDGRDQWLVTQGDSAGFEPAEKFAELDGRVNFIVGASPAPAGPPGAPPDFAGTDHRVRFAIDLVRFEPADHAVADRLLGTTVVVESLETAADLHRSGPVGFRYVTTGGDVLEADGTLRAGPLSASMGLLSRRSELDAVRQHLIEVEDRIVTLTRELTDNNAAARDIEKEQNDIRNDVFAAGSAKAEAASQLAQATDRVNALNREKPLLDREIASLVESFERLTNEETKLSTQKQAYETEQADRTKTVEALTTEHKGLAEEMHKAGETLTTARVSLGKVQEQQLACQQDVQRSTQSRLELIQQIDRLVKQAASIVDKRAAVEQELATAKHAESALEKQKAELAAEVAAATERVTASTAEVKETAAGVESARTRATATEQKLHRLQLESNEMSVRLETLITRTQDELQLDLPAAHAALEGVERPETDWSAVAVEIKELKEKIQRLGSVNVDAIAEQEQLSQRQVFLSTQVADLAESKKQLEELIDQINVESSARFEATFNAVREHFQVMFRKLFGGGKADVFLDTGSDDDNKAADGIGGSSSAIGGETGPDGQMSLPKVKRIDLLDAGIEITARPPGKQPATISQLSGGEKTMTCIALLMSIFKSKPSPFCILDEVDAALDEANNQRFNLIVQEFVEQSQFIVITHSKRTMQIADVLYGVTMQEQGVSKRVSVKFDQVQPDGRIDEHAAA